jgi:hypothetical protein
MLSYLLTYCLAAGAAYRASRCIDVPLRTVARYTCKSGNLAVCFLGLSVHAGYAAVKRSAEIGMLASLFDLVSDELRFNDRYLRYFRDVLTQTVSPEVEAVLVDLLEIKKSSSFRMSGLERGVGAFRAVIKHLESEAGWPSDFQIIRSGIMLQIVDDLLDHKQDLARDELNFVRGGEAVSHIQSFLRWDYRREFSQSKHPIVLFAAIRRARAIALKLLEDMSSETVEVEHGCVQGDPPPIAVMRAELRRSNN